MADSNFPKDMVCAPCALGSSQDDSEAYQVPGWKRRSVYVGFLRDDLISRQHGDLKSLASDIPCISTHMNKIINILNPHAC